MVLCISENKVVEAHGVALVMLLVYTLSKIHYHALIQRGVETVY